MLDRYFKIESREREAVNWITRGVPAGVDDAVSYTHLTLPTNREV